jgi:hypothetical protein
MLPILPPTGSTVSERAEARRMVHVLVRELRTPAWHKGRPDQVARMDYSIIEMIRAWRRHHTATLRWAS